MGGKVDCLKRRVRQGSGTVLLKDELASDLTYNVYGGHQLL